MIDRDMALELSSSTNLEGVDAQLYDMIAEIWQDSVEPLTGNANNGQVTLSILQINQTDSESGQVIQRTRFNFEIDFDCLESNSHITSEAAVRQLWTKFTSDFTSLPSIIKYFPAQDENEPDSNDFQPSPPDETDGGDDDTDDGKPSSGNPIVSFTHIATLLAAVVLLLCG